jgi:hypothetical protein
MPLIVNIIAILIIVGVGIYYIRSLLRKMRVNPNRKIELAIGIVVWTWAIGILIYMFIKTIENQL